MPDTKRQKIVSAIIAACETIDGSGDYETTIGASVYDFQLNFQDDELPAMSVCDVGQELAPDDVARIEEKDCFLLEVKIRVAVSIDTRAAECRKMVGDIITMIGANRIWYDEGGAALTKRNVYARDEFVLDEQTFHIAAVEVTLGVLYLTEQFNAYE